jgi:hypothetical protein
MGKWVRAVLVVAVSGEPPVALGDDQLDRTALALERIVTMIGGVGDLLESSDESGLPKFEEVTKGMVSKKGLFILWHYPPADQDKDQEKLLAQIPASFLGEQFMLSTSLSGGGFYTGFPLDERVVRWELLDKQLVLIEPETRYVTNSGSDINDAVRRTYPERIRVAVPLVTKSPAGDPVIDLGSLLKSDFADIGWMTRGAGSYFGGAGINPRLSKWTKHKTFELNVEIGVELAVSRSAPPGSYDKKMVHYSFWRLPQTDYQPRLADDRVGYFLTTNRDWSKPVTERDIFNRYINRWHLVKRDPSLPLCEPRKPIVFYIEKTVPVRYRRAVRDGILEWNKAFERIGFLNAIEVRQQTSDNEWKDLDPEDMRYSFIRWIVTGAGFAMGPSRANPFTGEILDADILFDDSMVRAFQQEAEHMLPQAVAEKLRDPALQDLLERCPELRRTVPAWTHQLGEEFDPVAARDLVRHRMAARGRHGCDYCEGMKHQMQVAHALLANEAPELRERFLYEVIKETVTHEVGHTLGLRHNFAASTIYTLDEIQRRRTTGEPTSGSIMDYNPVLFFADKATEGHFVTPTIGPYDYWAIEYGYRPFDQTYKSARKEPTKDESDQLPAETAAPEAAQATPAPATATTDAASTSITLPDLSDLPPELLAQLPPEIRRALESGDMSALMSAVASGLDSPVPVTPGKAAAGPKFAAPPAGEEAMLREIAGRAAEPELLYATDEDATYLSPDPRADRFDMGMDPLDWARSRIELIDQRMANILEWAVKDAESWYFLRRAFLTLLSEKTFVLDYVGRYIGGQYFSRAHRGDANAPAPFVLVDAARQRQALAFIEETLYTDKFLSFPPEVLNHLAPSRWSHPGTSISYSMDFPIHDIVGLLQWWNLFDRLNPEFIRRIYDAELKTAAPDKLTAAEYRRRLQEACWADATSVERLRGGQWSDSEPFLSSMRRSLQREYLGLAEPLVRRRPGQSLAPDLHGMLHFSLEKLARELGEVVTAGQDRLDFASAAHLTACKSRIDRILSAELGEPQSISLGVQ